MQLFLDSANFREIEHWLAQGVIDGVTTNPSIMFKDGIRDLKEGARKIAKILGKRPLSVEVTTNDRSAMLHQARTLATWSENIVVKIPIVNQDGESCLGVVNALSKEGVAINATAILSFNQAMLAAKAGARYVSIFGGRIADEGTDPATVIRNVRRWLDDWGQTSQIIVGSIRTVLDIQNAALAGAHVVTVPPQFFPKMVDHKYSRETVRQFIEDAEKTLSQIDTDWAEPAKVANGLDA